MKRRMVTTIVVFVLVAVGSLAVYLLVVRDDTPEGGPPGIGDNPGVVMPWSGPIPGVRADLAAVKASFALPGVPIVGPTAISGPCVDPAHASMTLLESWTLTTKPHSSTRLGFVFTNGVWMSVGSLAEFSSDMTDSKGELISVEEALKGDDAPTTLFTTSVRGHTAWGKDLSQGFACDRDSLPVSSDSGETPSPLPVGDPNQMFDVSKTASLRWVEHGAVIHLVGPVDLDTLKVVAGSIEWSE